MDGGVLVATIGAVLLSISIVGLFLEFTKKEVVEDEPIEIQD